MYQYENGLLRLWYNHTMEYWSAIKKGVSLIHITWLYIMGIILSKRSQTQKFFIYHYTQPMVKKIRTEVCLSVAAVNWLAEDMKEFFDRDVDSKDVSKMYLFVKTIQFTIGPLAMPLLGVHPEKNMIWKDTGIPMFIAAVFTQPRHESNLGVHWQRNGQRRYGSYIP